MGRTDFCDGPEPQSFLAVDTVPKIEWLLRGAERMPLCAASGSGDQRLHFSSTAVRTAQ